MRRFVLVHAEARRRALACVAEAPDGYVVAVGEATKKRVQEERYHALIGEIAAQSSYAGKRWDKENMKRIMVDEFVDAMKEAGTPLRHSGQLIPSENGQRVIQLGVQTRDFTVAEASNFIDFLTAWGIDRGVMFEELAGVA
jgi:hypothetical protein